MKKITYLLACALLFSQSVQAGKDFFTYSESNGVLCFKKSGKSFEKANEVVGKFATHHTVRQVRFHEKVSREQQEKVIANICSTAHLHHLGSGFFEDEEIHNYNETLINLIKNNVMCMKNNYVAGWRS
ncbi:MAG TPA: hypothetical protein VMW10_07875, partial [Alphaproteobacteria bacterium]|nr:hypothetical protein [Alphaproteobacteria bacterium]